ncbi:MAG: DUF1214 domain-containing protein [Halieaceae bacterium]
MSRALGMLAALLLLGLAFVAGRMTAPAAEFRPGQLAGDAALEQAWDEFLLSQQAALDLLRSSDFFEDDQERAEAYRGILYTLVGAIKTGALLNPDQPRFMPVLDWTSKGGLDNPDDNYYLALLRDDATYRVRGNRGSSADLVFQLLAGQAGVRGAESGDNISVLYGSDITTDTDGNFEIIVSRKQPAKGVNWLPSAAGAESLLVRFTHNNWLQEDVGALQIERIGAEAEQSPPLTPMRMALALQNASASVFDRTATWLKSAEQIWRRVPRNSISAVRPSADGLVGQYAALGSWELDNDDALILSTAASDAIYQGLALGNLWFASLDYENRSSSLNLDQLQCSGDGRCYAVVSHRDPGFTNWLDTEGHRRGLIMMRWQGLAEDLPADQQPAAQLVPFAELAEHLPADMLTHSPRQRTEQIRQRRAGAQSRFSN